MIDLESSIHNHPIILIFVLLKLKIVRLQIILNIKLFDSIHIRGLFLSIILNAIQSILFVTKRQQCDIQPTAFGFFDILSNLCLLLFFQCLYFS